MQNMKVFNLFRKVNKKTKNKINHQEVRQVVSFVIKNRSGVLKDLAEYDRGVKTYTLP
jgi:hypothetical protein